MWLSLAFLSALFSGLTAILAKCGMKDADPKAANAVRTAVILLCALAMAEAQGSLGAISTLSLKTWVFLVLSGLATGMSWLCFFFALKLSEVSRVVTIDKSSTVLAMLLGIIFLGESLSAVSLIAMILIGLGTLWMAAPRERQAGRAASLPMWLIYALLSAFFAALTALLSKLGMSDINTHLGTAIRTAVVLLLAVAALPGSGRKLSLRLFVFSAKELFFIIASGLAAAASWLCYFKALALGPMSIVVPIDKLSILITVIFSSLVLREKLSLKACLGLVLILGGTLLLLKPSLAL